MAAQTLPRPAQLLIATLYCALVLYAVGDHAIPWTLARLPLAFPLTVFLSVALVSICWSTVDVYRGRA
jgi:hypothetical protein